MTAKQMMNQKPSQNVSEATQRMMAILYPDKTVKVTVTTTDYPQRSCYGKNVAHRRCTTKVYNG